MLRPHLFSMALFAALLMAGGCAQPQPVETAEERPSAQEVAREASEGTKRADEDDLVLYSSSIDEADEADESGARAGETPVEEEPTNEASEEEVSDEETSEQDAPDDEQPADDAADDVPEALQTPPSEE